MNKLESIKSLVLFYLEFWKKEKEKNNNELLKNYYTGAIDSLEILFKEIEGE